MTALATREQASAAVAAAVAERDTIQANLLDLDGSFGKRLLAGAPLTGESQRRWAAANADLTTLWETFNAYSAVIDRAAEIAAGIGRAPGAKIAEISGLLDGPAVRLARAPAPLAQRELTTGPSTDLTIAAAVTAMKRSYGGVAAVCGAAEAIWNEIADGLQQAGASLDQAQQQSAGLADAELTSALAVAQANLTQLRDRVNTDPLALGPAGDPGNAAAAALAGLRQQVTAAAARAGELYRLRGDGDRRIAAVASAVAAAAVAWQDALAAQQRAAAKIADAAPAQLADPAELSRRVAGVREFFAAGRWTRLAADLDTLEKDAAAAEHRYREAEHVATARLDQRDEMRGLLEAYQAKAARLGGAENAQLAAMYEQARAALGTAPCDVASAEAAVSRYQQAVLALGAPGGRA